jgi:hypothetical protein
VSVQLGGPDVASLRLLETWPGGLLFSPLITGPSPTLDQYLREQYFTNGAPPLSELLGEVPALRKVIGPWLKKSDDLLAQLIGYYIQRARNYAHVESMSAAGIEEAVIVTEDAMPLPKFCSLHDRRVVSISPAMRSLERHRTLSRVNYSNEVFGRRWSFPPIGLDCTCRMEGIITGISD